MDENLSYLADNLKQVKDRIAYSAQACGRNPSDIRLIAAVKYTDAAHIDYLHRLGVNEIGENRVQQLLEHWEQIDRTDLKVHFIGTLQTNKVKYIIDKVCMIHSLDSDKLAEEIDKQAKRHGLTVDVLVEINSGCEESKSGVLPQDVEALCREIMKYQNIRLCGFMTMAPKCQSKDEYRGYFEKTYAECVRIWTDVLGFEGKPFISMGMTDSFEEAILEGSDAVRVGSGLFRQTEV